MLELLVLAIAPGVFLTWFFYVRDRYEREPKKLIILTYFLGVLSVVPAFFLELFGEWLLLSVIPTFFLLPQDRLITLLVNVFIVIALTEEFMKFCAVRVLAYRSPEFNEVMDGIVYCAAAALGFATLENVIYVLKYGFLTAIVRAVLSVPGHALWGGIMGYQVGLAKFQGVNENIRFLLGLLMAVFLHGLYDFIVFFFDILLGLSMLIVLMILSSASLYALMRKASEVSPFKLRVPTMVQQGLFCPYCGRPMVYVQAYDAWYCYWCETYYREEHRVY